MKVLLADDSATTRLLVRSHLASLGITDVTEEADGTSLAERLRDVTFDLVLFDWTMPGPSGVEVLRSIRAEDPRVPVIVVTTESERSSIVAAVRAGANGYLVKPVARETLATQLARIVSEPYGTQYAECAQ